MDLLSSIKKSGSRGGVNFSWDQVSTSTHRENYLGHSLMAPVGRWQKGKDLGWYAKGDDKGGLDGETPEQRQIRERKEEIRKIKEAEEDALARALGLPVEDRGLTGSNAISVGEVNKVVKEVGVGQEGDVDTSGKGKGFGDFVGKLPGAEVSEFVMEQEGGLVGKSSRREDRKDERSRSRERRHRRHRHRSRSGERKRHRSRSDERHHRRSRREGREERRPRSRSVERSDKIKREDREDRRPRDRSAERSRRKYRSRSPERKGRPTREEREARPRRSRSPYRRERDSERR